ncbi:MAG: hypothetical protein K2N47_01055, partial [Clostridia bacterium]|nr:hypothetical protein [Clostridia bacterium]
MKKMKKLDVKSIVTLVACDFGAIVLSTFIAVLSVKQTIDWELNLLWWSLANLGVTYAFFVIFRMYYLVFDSVGLLDTLKHFIASLCIFGVGCAYSWVFDFNIWVQFTYAIILFITTLAMRYGKRIYLAIKFSFTRKNNGKIRAMIIGGGDAGAALIREIQ